MARKGGRYRWKIENEGFNRQKNSGLNLEHVYSNDPEKWKAYYYLLQIAFVITQLLERGSLLLQLVAGLGKDGRAACGSPAHIAPHLADAPDHSWRPPARLHAHPAPQRPNTLY